MKNVYFLSDAHLGSLAIPHARMQERRLVRFLDSIKTKAAAVYLLGDMFDFWNEYKYVVPKGYTRFLGKLSELTDMGVEVHFFTGNHDLWTYGYLEEECGITVHYKPQTVEIYDKVFYLAHGDGLGDPDKKFKFLKRMFQNHTCHGRKEGVSGALCQTVYARPQGYRLLHVRPSPHRTGSDVEQKDPTDDSGRLDMAVHLCRV